MWILIAAILLAELTMLFAWYLVDRKPWPLKGGRPRHADNNVHDRNTSEPIHDITDKKRA